MKLARDPASSRPKPCVSLENVPSILPVRHSLWTLAGRQHNKVVRDHISPQNPPPVHSCSYDSRPQGFSTPLARAIELPSALTKPGAYSPDKTCHGTLARAAVPYQTFRDSATCLSRATSSKGHEIGVLEEAHLVNTILNQPNRHRVSTGRLSRVD